MKSLPLKFKRCLALVLAVTLIVSGINLGSKWRASADDSTTSKTVADLVAENYADKLSDAEEKLLASGYLVGDTYVYTKPADDDELVQVNTDDKTITAAEYSTNGLVWVPVTAKIVVDEAAVETKALVKVGTEYTCGYDYSENAFSVEVVYELKISVDADLQETLLGAAGALKAGVEVLKSVQALNDDLVAIAGVLPQLAQFATPEGYVVTMGQATAKIGFDEDVKVKVNALLGQLEENGNGLLDLNVMIQDSKASASKVEYLVNSGADLKAALEETKGALKAMINSEMGPFAAIAMINTVDPTLGSQVSLLKSVIKGWVGDAEDAIEADWGFVGSGMELLNDNVDYAKLDILVAALETVVDSGSVDVETNLLADMAGVRVNMSMCDVIVKVDLWVAGAVDSTELVKYDTHTVVVTLAEGTSETDIIAAVAAKGIEAAAIAKWGETYVAGQYTAKAEKLPHTLTEDITYTITYAPVSYKVTLGFSEDALTVPYGYRMTLPVYVGTDVQVYDYTVNGESFYQGEVVTITGDTQIDREKGKEYMKNTLFQLLADQKLASEKEAAILLSGALKLQDDNVWVRVPSYPGNDDGLIDLDEAEKKVTAKEYASAYKDLKWKPVSLNVYKNNVSTGKADVVGTATGQNGVFYFDVDAYDYVEVVYELDLGYSEDELLSILNTVVTLANEAKAQLEMLDRLAGKAGELSSVTKTVLNAATSLEDITKYYQLDTTIPALKNVVANCFDEDGKLLLGLHIEGYLNAGLAYYYQLGVSEAMQEQLAILIEQMGLIAADPGLAEALAAAGFPQYVDKIEKIPELLGEVELIPVNAVINRESSNLAVLGEALKNAGELEEHKSLENLLILTAKPTENYSGNMSITVNVVIDGVSKAISVVLPKGTTVTKDVIAGLLEDIEELTASLSGNRYTNDYNANELKALAGNAYVENISYTYTWAIKTINVVGGTDVVVESSNGVVTLKLAGIASNRYVLVYTIGGKTFEVDSINGRTILLSEFSDDVIDGFYANGLTYSVATEDKYYNQLVGFVTNLNSATNGALEFTLIENGEEFSIVMNIVSVEKLTGALMGFGEAALKSGYGSIGLDTMEGYAPFMEMSEEIQVYLQTLVDAIFAVDGVGTQTLLDAIKVDGTINYAKAPVIAGDKIVIGASKIGALLFQTKMQLNDLSGNERFAPALYVTLGDAAGMLGSAREALDAVKNYVVVETKNGKVTVSLDLPEKIYEAYLTVLIVTGEVDLTDSKAVNNAIAFAYLEDLVSPLLGEDVTIDTYQNTIDKLGLDINVKQYETIFKAIQSLKFETSVDELYNMTVSAGVKAAIDGLGMGSFGSMIKEYKENEMISIDITADLLDAGTAFEALVVDPKNGALKDKADYTTNLINRIPGITGSSMIVLLDDIVGDLVFTNTTILDLNGFTVNGDIIAKGQLIILDSSLDTANGGKVTGEVTGSNVSVLGGTYGSDVKNYLKSGYVQNADGLVANKFYTISSDNGNVVFNLNADLLAGVERPSIKALALDLAWDLAVNYFTTAALSLDGNGIYAVNFEDLVGLLTGENAKDKAIQMLLDVIDCEGIKNFINAFVADCLKLADIENAIDNDEVILSYEMITKAWDVTLTHEKEGDYFTVNIVPGNEKVGSIGIKLVGEKANKDQIADLAGALSEIIVLNGTEIKLEELSDLIYKNQHIYVTVSGKAVVELDLSKNPEYAVIIGVVLGYGNNALKGTMAKAVDMFFETGSTYEIKKAFDKVSVNQVFNALKAMNRNTGFAQMAKAIGVKADVTSAATIEKTYHKLLIVAGAVLDRLDITGDNRKMGALLDGSDYGRYVLDAFDKNLSGAKEIYAGFGINYDLSATEVVLNVKLFTDDALIEVTDNNGEIVYKGINLSEAFAAVVGDGYTVKINGEVVMSKDIAVANKVTVVGAQNIKTLEGETPVFVLANANAVITVDAKLNVVVDVEALEGYVAKETVTDNEYVYAVSKLAVSITGSGVAGFLVYEKGNVKYLVVDLEPKKGMTWEAFLNDLKFADLAAYELTFNKEGAELVKTADEFVVVAALDGRVAAKVSYTVVVLGDTNCNGRVNSSDAPYIKDVSRGNYAALESKYNVTQIAAIELAADAGWNGNVNSSDVTTIMNKYFHWEDSYESPIGKKVTE